MLRHTATKNISREPLSATRDFHTPIGIIGMRCGFRLSLILILSFTQSTINCGSALAFFTNAESTLAAKNFLYGVRNSFATRGLRIYSVNRELCTAWALFRWSANTEAGVSRKSLAEITFSKSIAIGRLSAGASRRNFSISRQFPRLPIMKSAVFSGSIPNSLASASAFSSV